MSVFGVIQSECGKIRTRITPNAETFYAVLVESIRTSKEKIHLCLSAKLSDLSTSAKTYWSILKTFLMVKLEKSNIFNDFFSQQCQPISNESILPLIPSYYTDEILSGINFNHGKILRVI